MNAHFVFSVFLVATALTLCFLFRKEKRKR